MVIVAVVAGGRRRVKVNLSAVNGLAVLWCGVWWCGTTVWLACVPRAARSQAVQSLLVW